MPCIISETTMNNETSEDMNLYEMMKREFSKIAPITVLLNGSSYNSRSD